MSSGRWGQPLNYSMAVARFGGGATYEPSQEESSPQWSPDPGSAMAAGSPSEGPTARGVDYVGTGRDTPKKRHGFFRKKQGEETNRPTSAPASDPMAGRLVSQPMGYDSSSGLHRPQVLQNGYSAASSMQPQTRWTYSQTLHSGGSGAGSCQMPPRQHTEPMIGSGQQYATPTLFGQVQYDEPAGLPEPYAHSQTNTGQAYGTQDGLGLSMDSSYQAPQGSGYSGGDGGGYRPEGALNNICPHNCFYGHCPYHCQPAPR